MLFDFGTKGKMKSLGETLPIVCPHCGKPVSMLILQGYDHMFLLGVPIKEVDQCYFAACPSCAKVYRLAEEQAKQFAKGDKTAVTADGLTPPNEEPDRAE